MQRQLGFESGGGGVRDGGREGNNERPCRSRQQKYPTERNELSTELIGSKQSSLF